MPPKIIYRRLAGHLACLGEFADNAELVAWLREYEGGAAEWLVPCVEGLKPTDSWFTGLRAICLALKEQNPRFDVGLFEDWATEDL